MASEKSLVRALDLLTSPAHAGLMKSAAGISHVKNMRRVADTKNVVAMGISEKITRGKSTGVLALTFYVNRKKPLNKLGAHLAVPPLVSEPVGGEAIPTDVVAIGRPRLEVDDLANPLVTRDPIQPGFSIGHTKVEAGTLGAIVSKDGKFFILSNSHVLANSGQAKKGDKIVYPAIADDGKAPKDVVAKLVDFVQFKLGGSFENHVDCAIAAPLAARLDDLRSEIKGLSVPKGITKPERDMEIVKVGRTTGETVGKVRDIHFRFVCPYPDVGDVGYLDQVFCTRYSSGGDSGALVLERSSGKAVGLHFAGFPDKNGEMGSVFNPIDQVLTALGLKLVTKAIP